MKTRFDVVIVGAGPAGLAAAVTAAECGRNVGLVDDNPEPGGQIWRAGGQLPREARSWIGRLEQSPVERLQGWRVFDAPEPGVLRAERSGSGSEDSAELRCEELILATGARERFLPFPGWTLPNVMGAGGLDAMVRGGLPIEGKRVVVAGTGPLLLAVAAHLAGHGAKIVAICDQASHRQLLPLAAHVAGQPGKLWQGMQYRWRTRQSPHRMNCWPVAAVGDTKLKSVVLEQDGKRQIVECDYLACGFHLVPNIELAELLGCQTEDGFVIADESLRTSLENVSCAGEPTGIGGVEIALLEGRIAALVACGREAEARPLIRKRRHARGFVRALRQACSLTAQMRNAVTDETIVCRCEDVRLGSLRGRSGWRDAKLHTRCGMGPCQGRICGGAVEYLFGWRAESVRPPLFPALVSSLAGCAAETNNLDHMKETV
jgi:NADPH-dependent 2,4-dienoyl-CoA reductase/sulfur reductase-like enzyme